MNMKSLKISMTLLLGVLMAATVATAQPQGFSYQAVVRNAKGELVANSKVGLRVTLTDESGTQVMYRETHNVPTNTYGVLSVTVGAGKPDTQGATLNVEQW